MKKKPLFIIQRVAVIALSVLLTVSCKNKSEKSTESPSTDSLIVNTPKNMIAYESYQVF